VGGSRLCKGWISLLKNAAVVAGGGQRGHWVTEMMYGWQVDLVASRQLDD